MKGFPPMPLRRVRVLLLCLLGLLCAVAPVTAPVAHAAPGYAYYWSLTFDFENSFNGLLHVDVGYDENGGVQNPPLYAANFTVTCQRVGNVSLAGGSATFNGGYLACALDVKSALQTAFTQCRALVPGCTLTIEDVEKYQNFRLSANMTSPMGGLAPLFYHEDAAYAILPAMSDAQLSATLTPLGTMQSPTLPAALGVAHTYEALYECPPLAGCSMHFAIDGITNSVVHPNDAVAFSTPLSTVYIGYHPNGATIIPKGTQLAHLFIDPPNFGNN